MTMAMVYVLVRISRNAYDFQIQMLSFSRDQTRPPPPPHGGMLQKKTGILRTVHCSTRRPRVGTWDLGVAESGCWLVSMAGDLWIVGG